MHRIDISSNICIDLERFFKTEPEGNFYWEKILDQDDAIAYNLWRLGSSSTPYVIIHYPQDGVYSVMMEKLASYSDYKMYPIICSVLSMAVGVEQESDVDFEFMANDDWIAESIGEEIAYLKAVLSAGYKYMFNFGADEDYYIDTDVLKQFGVGLTSSTPRIYGYIQYALMHNMLEQCENLSEDYPDIEVDVPEHKSVGKVKSWQTDGSETWESYSKEDVQMLEEIGRKFLEENLKVEGVVLNDLGTLNMEGILMDKDYSKAVFWYQKAIENGDLLYAPSNMGDVYRKGGHGVVKNLDKAFRAYAMGDDPYAHYRVGQGFEEGWTGKQDQVEAFKWYAKAAEERHHLALKRLKNKSSVLS